MNYEHMITGTFLSRPNRFIAHVRIQTAEETEVVCHVKNTGRCRELLLPGVTVLVQFHPEAAARGRKTAYSLIGVYKEIEGRKILINMDSQAPNRVAEEWLSDMERSGRCSFSDRQIQNIRREVVFGQSRFDLAFEFDDGTPAFMEVKGVTLEEHGVAMFPDAPTERGIKHVLELARAASEGYAAYVLLVIQMKGVRSFVPNWKTHAAFGDALRTAEKGGVHILACDCIVTEDSLRIDQPVPVDLS